MQDNFSMQDWKLSRALQEMKAEDHEVAMALASLKAIVSSASQLITKLGNEERNIPGWIQDHITNAENYIEQANQGFHELHYEEEGSEHGDISESKNPHLYQIKGILTTNTEARTQGDILSDMRAIPGVTIVTPKDYQGGDTPIDNRRYTVELSVKIDPHPFKTFGKEQVKSIISQIKKVDGVITYKPASFMRRISETEEEI